MKRRWRRWRSNTKTQKRHQEEDNQEKPRSQGKRSHGKRRRFSTVEVLGDLTEGSTGGGIKRKAWLGWAQENGMKVLGQ